MDLDALDRAFHALAEGRDAILVEGAGGLLVPLTRDLAYDGLFVGWGLDLVVVAGNRLGTINHTLLTVRAAHDAGLRVRGVVLNALGPEPRRHRGAHQPGGAGGAAGSGPRAAVPLDPQGPHAGLRRRHRRGERVR